ncbi:MAG: carboxypeptidase-like regulatory domain-containing protein, partial [Flavobacteriaceae bacterium]|nr:carboxypeptidase-like regulatory domain-containing protein [Flavobacteriaceae bacterium]
MKTKFFLFIAFLFTLHLVAQTKVSGHVFDEFNDPVSFVNVFFKDSSEGTSTNENGRFYLESDQNWETLVISFIGYKNQEITLENKVTFDLKIVLKEEAAQLDAVVL